MHQSGVKAHLFFSSVKALLSVLHHRKHTGLPPLSSSPLSLACFALLHLCTWPIHSISSSALSKLHTFALWNLFHFHDALTHLPSPPAAAKPVTCRLRSTQSHFPISRPPCLILILSISPIPVIFTPQHPLTFHSCPLLVLSLPLISPLPVPNHYQFSLTHYLLLAPSLPPPLPLIPPLSIPVSAYPPYISSAFALPSPHLQQHEYIIIYTMGPCLLFMNYQPCGQTKPIFIRNLHFISAPIRLGAKE